jgi:hypothetical protein
LLVLFMVFAGESVLSQRSALKPLDEVLIIRRPKVRTVQLFLRRKVRFAVPRIVLPIFRGPDINQCAEMPVTLDMPVNTPPFQGSAELPTEEHPFRPDAFPSGISRRPDSRISLREEMVTLDDMDNGKYDAMVVQKGSFRNDIEGFLHIPIVWTEQNRFHLYSYIQERDGWAAIRLIEGMNRFTGIRAAVEQHLYLGSEKIFRTPFLFITADSGFELTLAERRNLGQYLRSGGFVFADNGTPNWEHGAAEASLKQMFRDALGSMARFEPIPNNHPLYHCYFEFDSPPPGAEIAVSNVGFIPGAGYDASKIRLPEQVFFLEGIFLEGRLVAVYSDKGYSEKWRQPFRRYQIDDEQLWERHTTPQLKMGVNLVVYALTREGGMTQRIMEQYRDIPD